MNKTLSTSLASLLSASSLLSAALLLSLAACGAVESSPAGAGDDGSANAGDDGSDSQPDGGVQTPGDTTPVPADAIMLEAPRAATTPNAISAIDHTTNAAVLGLITGTGTPRDVSEQRFVTLTDATIDLRVKLHSGAAIDVTRKIVMDKGDSGPALSPDYAHRVWCTSNHDTIDLGDPRCNLNPPVNTAISDSKAAMAAVWSVWVYDEASGEKVGCAADGDGASCLLPGRANHAYRVVVAVTNVPELWDGSAISVLVQQGRDYLGHTITQPYCWDYSRDTATQNFYCNTRYDYASPVGLDAATITFTNIRAEISANGITSMMPAAQLAWSYGEEDFPGPTY